MKLWIIYSKAVLNPNKNNAISWMFDEAEALGFETEIIFSEDLLLATESSLTLYHKGELAKLPDVAFLRCYDISMIQHLELNGVKTFNNAIGLNNCLDKWHTHQILCKQHIPSPKTLFTRHPQTYNEIKKQLGKQFIVKDNKGARGEQVFLIQDEESFLLALTKCPLPLFQEYIDTSYGKDVRIHVVGNQVVASVLRVSQTNFKSNYSQGGNVHPFECDDVLKTLAVKSTKALGLDFSGVDILFTENGYTVCEVNGVPGFRTVGLTSDVSLPYEMLTYIKEKCL